MLIFLLRDIFFLVFLSLNFLSYVFRLIISLFCFSPVPFTSVSVRFGSFNLTIYWKIWHVSGVNMVKILTIFQLLYQKMSFSLPPHPTKENLPTGGRVCWLQNMTGEAWDTSLLYLSVSPGFRQNADFLRFCNLNSFPSIEPSNRSIIFHNKNVWSPHSFSYVIIMVNSFLIQLIKSESFPFVQNSNYHITTVFFLKNLCTVYLECRRTHRHCNGARRASSVCSTWALEKVVIIFHVRYLPVRFSLKKWWLGSSSQL